jgi:hypothetical protein
MWVGDQVQRDVAATLDAATFHRCDREALLGPRQKGNAGCLANGPLKDKSARVVADAAHHVQPTWRAGDEDRIAAVSDAVPRPCACAQPSRHIGGESFEIRNALRHR